MDFSHLPDTAFLRIFECLPLEDCIRIGRVDKRFRRFAQLTTSQTKSLSLNEDRFRNLSDNQLAVILDLCWPNLEKIKFPSRDSMEYPTARTDRNEQLAAALDNHGKQLATIFASYECPRLIDIDLGCTPIDYAIFEQLIRNNPNMESVIWKAEFVGFPNITNNSLKQLNLRVFSDTALQSLIGRCPNLKELDLITENVVGNVLDQFFGSIPEIHKVNFCIRENNIESELVNFWNLPLTSLNIDFPGDHFLGYSLLQKLATSFPNLKELRLWRQGVTNAGIAFLAALKELEILQLSVYDLDGDQPLNQGICQVTHCKRLQKFDMSLSEVSGGTLVHLIRGCPHLEHVIIWKITEVANPEEAVVILESLAGIAQRLITIEICSTFDLVTLKSIWDAGPVKEAIGKLEENDGLKIKLTLRMMQEMGQ